MKSLNINTDEYSLYGFQSNGSYIIPPHYQPKKFSGDGILWLIPLLEEKSAKLFTCKAYTVKRKKDILTVIFDGEYTVQEFPSLPCCDFFGNRMMFDLPEKEIFEKTFAKFYWDNLLNQIAERTFMVKKKDVRDGYVLSTLNKKAYAGTYPAVDHEFHMKGRFAVGGKSESALIRRMLALQLKIMREDRKKLYRNVCSVQPNRRREYNVWRKSKNGKCKAQMFRITANIEFVEGVYNYYCLTKELGFLMDNITDIEMNCDYIERFIGEDGFLASHVYYEDQVIKDGTVLQAQLFSANAFRLMGEIELLLNRQDRANHYLKLSKRLGEKAVKPYPDGFWDSENNRFIDWIDAKGQKHDHIHLLANELPELFGFADNAQISKSRETIESNKEVFDKFPSFVAAKIEEYTADEIGVGGPYDLCAAGRYWCWDAEYLAFIKSNEKLLKQLLQVCSQAETDNYFMGERYDMNYVYYNSGNDAQHNWHGASLYYEYPNVWIYVLLCKYLGVRRGFKEDLIIEPLFENGSVTLEQYGIAFTVSEGKVTEIRNLQKENLKVTLPMYNKTYDIAGGDVLMSGI